MSVPTDEIRRLVARLEAALEGGDADAVALPSALRKEVHRLQATIDASEARFDLLSTMSGLVVFRFDNKRRHVFVTPNIQEHFGIEAATHLGKTHPEAGYTPDQARFWGARIQGVIDTCSPCAGALSTETDGFTRHFHWRLEPLDPRAGKATSVLGVAREVTEELETKAELARSRTHDPVTALLLREEFDKRAAKELARADRGGGHVSMILLDVDSFASIYELGGEIAGDSVLFTLAEAARSSVRSYDIVGRFGRDEVVLLLPDAEPEQAGKIADRIRVAIKTQLHSEAGDGSAVTISAGVASYPGHGESLDELTKTAVRALARVTTSGGDAVRVAELADTYEIAQVTEPDFDVTDFIEEL